MMLRRGRRQVVSPRLRKGPTPRHHDDGGRRRRPLPLEAGVVSILSEKGTSLAGAVACVASRLQSR